MKLRAPIEVGHIPALLIFLLGGCSILFAQEVHCDCSDPPGGRVTCEKDQVAMCRVVGGKVYATCSTPPRGEARGDKLRAYALSRALERKVKPEEVSQDPYKSILLDEQFGTHGETVTFSIPEGSPHERTARRRNWKRQDTASAAAEVFTEIMNERERAIPKELLDKAEAIAVFPDVVKAAFIFGGKGGEGLISRRTPKGWSAPAFFNIGGGNFGAQIGASKTDYVLLIMNQDGLKGLLEEKFELGGEIGIAAGPVGREAAASTNATLDAGILSYSRSKGAFIGATLKGAVISPDNHLNEAVYNMKARDVLAGKSMTLTHMPAGVRIFPRTLARYSIR